MKDPTGDPVSSADERVTGAVGRVWVDLRRWARSRPVLASAIGASVMLAVVAFACAEPLVRSIAVSRARGAGIDLRIGSIELGLFTVRLRDVDVVSSRVPAITARLGLIEVHPSAGLGVKSLAVHGGKVIANGPREVVERQVRAFRSDRPATSGSMSSPAVAVAVDGIDVIWEEGPTSRHHAWGIFYERSAERSERFGADRVRFADDRGGVEVVGASVTTRRQDGRRVVAAISATGVVADVDAARLPLPVASRAAGGARASGTAAAHPPESAQRKVREALSKFTDLARDSLESGAKLALSDVRLRVHGGGETLNLGPAELSIERDAARVRVALSQGRGAGNPALRLGVDAPLGPGSVVVDLDGGPLSLAALGVHEGDMGLVRVRDSRVQARGRVTLSEDASSLSFTGRAAFESLCLHEPKLASEVVEGIDLSASAHGRLALDGSRIDLDEAEVSLGRVRVRVAGHILRSDGDASGSLQVQVPLAACQDMFDSTPAALLPLLRGTRWGGTFSFDGKVGFDTKRPADLEVELDLSNECRLEAVPDTVHPARFSRPWTRTVEGIGDELLTIDSGPGTAHWVPFSEISRHVETAVIICEDSRFWTHDGFDLQAIRDSIRDNVRAGRFVRGASTVSMQLAKNLYLGREKTLSRKLQEAALTLLLEQELEKEELLELYLNVIEFGPGIFGIGPAARHYFNTEARDLSLGQALYLASILPNPKNQHFADDGKVSEKWTTYLHRLMHIAHKIHRIDDDELETGLAETVAFGVSSLPELDDAAFVPSTPARLELGP